MSYQRLQKQLHEACKVENTLMLASQIWLAGIGALARAQQEGREFFDQLVQCGEVIEVIEDDGLKKLKRLARRVLAGSGPDPLDTPTLEDIRNLAVAIQNFDLHLSELDSR